MDLPPASESINLERSIPPRRAIELFEQEIRTRGLTSVVKAWGGARMQTSHCILLDQQGNLVAQGSGKGLGLQSAASARFEALEHLHTRMDNPGSMELLCLEDMERAGKSSVLDALPAAAEEDAEVRSAMTHWLRFTSLSDSRDVYVPVFAIDPGYIRSPAAGNTFPLDRIDVFSTNSGTAAGCSFDEALLHSLNEQIERFALGAFLHRSLMRRTGRSACLIDKHSLPERLRVIVAEIEATFDEDVLIFEMEESFGVPSFIAVSTRREAPDQLKGSGTSLSPTYALERALLELLQVLHFSEQPEFRSFNEHRAARLETFRDWPDLLRCFCKDFSGAIRAGELTVRERRFEGGPAGVAGFPLDLRTQSERVVRALRSAGHEVLVATLFASKATGISCVRTYIPELDNTWMLAEGNFLRPNRQCLERLTRARE